MCFPEAQPTRCRSKQLFDAAERIIDYSRLVGRLEVSQKFTDLAALEKARDHLAELVAVFDRLNRGL